MPRFSSLRPYRHKHQNAFQSTDKLIFASAWYVTAINTVQITQASRKTNIVFLVPNDLRSNIFVIDIDKLSLLICKNTRASFIALCPHLFHLKC